ncbi:MAG: hypothetical protein FP816_02660 [Desulfobacteraceae bacterium]|nr:hypothetical protein [Desulfobacteraceae bacterium]
MTRIVIKMLLVWMIVLTMPLTGCSSESDYNQKALDRIAKIIQQYNKEFSEKGMKYPSEAIVFRQPASTGEKGGDIYWMYRENKFSEISKETSSAYQKGKVRFNGKSGDYYDFSFFLFAEDDGGKTRGGVLFLPDGNKIALELKK